MLGLIKMICPNCRNKIEFLAIFRSFWPTRVLCQSCGVKLGFKHGHVIGGVVVVTLFTIFAIEAGIVIRWLEGQYFIVIISAVAIIYLVSVELFILATTSILRRYGELILWNTETQRLETDGRE